jgi:hypothetical protein
MPIDVGTRVLFAVTGGLGAMLIFAVPAIADPAVPLPGPPAPSDPATPPPAPDATISAAAGQLPTPPEGVPHLSSPENLPPGATMDPSEVPRDNPNVSYLKDLWQAVQNHEISGKQALIMGLAQRGMDSPYPQQPPGPNVPVTPPPAAIPFRALVMREAAGWRQP